MPLVHICICYFYQVHTVPVVHLQQNLAYFTRFWLQTLFRIKTFCWSCVDSIFNCHDVFAIWKVNLTCVWLTIYFNLKCYRGEVGTSKLLSVRLFGQTEIYSTIEQWNSLEVVSRCSINCFLWMNSVNYWETHLKAILYKAHNWTIFQSLRRKNILAPKSG